MNIDTPVQEDILVELLFLRDAAAVRRFHTKRTIQTDTLARHSFGVMQLIHFVWPECRKELVLAGMFHDLPEYVTGDIPAPVKRESPQMAVLLEELEKGAGPLYQDFHLTPAEETVLRWCDMVELALWCTEEVTLGNRYCIPPIKNVMRWCADLHQSPQYPAMASVPPHVRQSMDALFTRILKHTGGL